MMNHERTPEETHESRNNFFRLRKRLTSVKKVDNLPRIKLVLIGSGGVGKSALTIQYFQKDFLSTYDPTIEDSYVKHLIVDNFLFVMDVMDTAGQEEYSSMTEQYMRMGDGFLIVYSVNDLKSFKRVSNFHTQVLRVKDKDHFPMILVANKVDLTDRQVTKEMGEELAKSLGIEYIETSAKDPPRNVNLAFQQLVRVIRRYSKREKRQSRPPRCSCFRRAFCFS